MFDGYLIITSNFSHLYRNTIMSEFEFFKERADRLEYESSLGQLRDLFPHKPYKSSPAQGRGITLHWPLEGLGRCP